MNKSLLSALAVCVLSSPLAAFSFSPSGLGMGDAQNEFGWNSNTAQESNDIQLLVLSQQKKAGYYDGSGSNGTTAGSSNGLGSSSSGGLGSTSSGSGGGGTIIGNYNAYTITLNGNNDVVANNSLHSNQGNNGNTMQNQTASVTTQTGGTNN